MNIFLQHDIKEFGAEVYKDTLNSNIGKTEVDYVRFLRKEYTQNILNCVWNSFSIRDVISTWLKDCMFMKRSTMTYRVNLTFVHFAKLDFHYFAHKIIKKLYDEKDIITDRGLVQIILGLEKDEICTSNIVKMIEQWSNLKERHHLLVILLYCTGNKDRIEYIERAVQHYLDWISQHFENMSEYEFNKIIREFLLVGMRDYMFYRILINKLYSLSLQRNINNYVCWLFLIMFFVDTDYSSFEEEYTKEAVFVKLAYSPNQVRSELCKLWQMLWSRNEFKQQFYYAMGRYFAKVPDNIRREKIVQFVSASFMGFCNESYKVDIIKRIDKQSRRLNNYE